MRNVFIALVGMVALLTVSAIAGDYHSGASLNCQECHVMHASQQHGYAADGTGDFIAPNGTHHFLLRDEINTLCLTCHDGVSTLPDVLATNGGQTPTNGRQGGALNRDNTAPYFDATGHTLGSTDVAPGGTWSNVDGLSCVDCHTQHGRTLRLGTPSVTYSMYRNANVFINGTPTVPVMTYAVGTNNTAYDIFETSASFGGDHYSPRNVNFNEPDQTRSGYGQYCQQCHTDFHGSQSSANMRNTGADAQQEWYRHPTADADLGFVGGGHSSLSKFAGKPYRVQVMSSTEAWGDWGTAIATPATDLTPSCMSCHKAHGNQRPFGLIFATGNASFDEDGDGANYKVLCGQCHVQQP